MIGTIVILAILAAYFMFNFYLLGKSFGSEETKPGMLAGMGIFLFGAFIWAYKRWLAPKTLPKA